MDKQPLSVEKSSTCRSNDANIDIKLPYGDTPIVAVLGTGRYGRAMVSRLEVAGYDVRFGSRTPGDGIYTSVDAVKASSIVFLCVPPFAHESILSTINPHLNPGTILVDISNHGLAAPPRRNNPSIAEWLAKRVPEGVIVAKALNTLPAETLEKDPLPFVVPPPARIACDDRRAAKKLGEVFTDMTLAPVIVGPLRRARDLERQSHRQFPSWHVSTFVAIVIFAFWLIYYSLYHYVAVIPATELQEERSINENADALPMKMLIHVMAETGMVLFSLTFIAGPIATIIQLVRGTASKPYWKWLTVWLNMRKEIGLIALGFIFPHSIAGLTEVRFPDVESNIFYCFGILSLTGFLWLSVSSFPSVASGLSWREARAVFSWLGLLSYLVGAIHQVIYAYHIDRNEETWPRLFGSIPMMSTAWLGFILIAATFLLRAIVWLPPTLCFVRNLHWDKRFDTVSEPAEDSVDVDI